MKSERVAVRRDNIDGDVGARGASRLMEQPPKRDVGPSDY